VLFWLVQRLEVSVEPNDAARSVFVPLSLSVLVLSLFAVVATSCGAESSVVSMASNGSSVWVQFDSTTQVATTTSYAWVRSDDGGLTFKPSSAPTVGVSSPTQGCLSSGDCFRGIQNQYVEEKPVGGTWKPAVGYRAKDRGGLSLNGSDGCVSTPFRTVSVLRVGGVETVVVDAGTQGVILRESSGRWRPVAIDRWVPTVAITTKPAGLPLAISNRYFLLVPGFGILLSPALMLLRRKRRGRRAAFGVVILVFGCAVSLTLPAFTRVFSYDAGPPMAVLSALAFVVSLIVARSEATDRPPPPLHYPPDPGHLPGPR
jgi:hypothetical protein